MALRDNIIIGHLFEKKFHIMGETKYMSFNFRNDRLTEKEYLDFMSDIIPSNSERWNEIYKVYKIEAERKAA